MDGGFGDGGEGDDLKGENLEREGVKELYTLFQPNMRNV
jgi:hypothetical protein